jgi:Zn-dependent protease with chaperone function
MIYNAKLPDDSVNIPKENILLQATKLAFSLLIIVAVLYAFMVMLVNLIVANITPEQEKELLSYIAFDINISNEKSAYLTEIKDKLTACTDIPYDVEIFVSSEEIANAYALPGGVIHITKGMLSELKTQNELAFIIGHELGHFKNKDHLKGLGHSLVLLSLALLIDDDYSILGHTLSAGGAKYSQSAELHSDKVGLELLNCAYGSVTDATKTFERMGEGHDDWEFFLASHPNFDTRVEKMKEMIEKENMDTSKASPVLKNIFD